MCCVMNRMNPLWGRQVTSSMYHFIYAVSKSLLLQIVQFQGLVRASRVKGFATWQAVRWLHTRADFRAPFSAFFPTFIVPSQSPHSLMPVYTKISAQQSALNQNKASFKTDSA